MQNYLRVSKLKDYDLNRKKPKKIDMLGIKIESFYKRVEKLQRECFLKEREELKRKKEKETQINQIQLDKSNIAFTKIKQMTKQFFRDSSKKCQKDKDFLTQRHVNIDNANRNIETNRVKNHLQKVALKFVAPKCRIDNKRDESYEDIKQLILQAQKSLNKRKKQNLIRLSVTPLKTNNNGDSSMNNTFHSGSSKCLFDKKIRLKRGNKSSFHSFGSNGTSSMNYMNTSRTAHGNQSFKDKVSVDFDYKGKGGIKFSEFDSERGIKEQKINHSSTCRSFSMSKVVNKPIKVGNVEEIIKDYNNVKEQMKREKSKFMRRHLLSQEQIDDIMNIREEMKLIKVKQKYFGTKFPKRKEKIKNSLQEFISEIGDIIAIAENKFYLREKHERIAFALESFINKYPFLKK